MANYLYRQIKDWLEQELDAHADVENYPLPSETQLMIRFRCSRIAVRRALAELEAEDRIYKLRGKGSFAKHVARVAASQERIGVILPACDTKFLADMLLGITETARRLSAIPSVYVTWNSPELETQYLADAQKNCRGILFMPEDGGYLSDTAMNLRLVKTPLVFLDRRLSGFTEPCVSSDHYRIGYEAVRYLHGRGHRHLVYLGFFPLLSSVSARQKGYEAALLDFYGKIERKNLILDDAMPDDIFPFWLDYFTRNPDITGIIAPSGYPGELLLKVMRRLRKTLNEDYEILFIDNGCDYVRNVLGAHCASIVQDAKEIGRSAASLLFDIIARPDAEKEDVRVPFVFRDAAEGRFRPD